MTAQLKAGIDPRAHRLVAKPLQVGDVLANDRRGIGQVGERRPAPQPHRPRQGAIDGSRIAADEWTCLRHRRFEALGIQLSRPDPKGVPGLLADDPLPAGGLAQEGPEARNVHLQEVVRAGRRNVAPELVDEPVIGHGETG